MFRGPKGDGSVENSTLPLEWGEDKNVLWKTPIPHWGWSTPVVLDNRVWLTSATKKGHDFYAFCIDAATGKVLFEKHLFHCEKPEPLSNAVNSYASPSPAIRPLLQLPAAGPMITVKTTCNPYAADRQ